MKQIPIRLQKTAVSLFCLLPLVLLLFRGLTGRLGANPVETLTFSTGDWTMRFLIATLSITPLSNIFGWKKLVSFRRSLGLFALFYGCLHLLIYIGLDYLFNFDLMFDDAIRTPSIIVGFISLLLLIPLGVTSKIGWVRRLGKQRWDRIHQLVYVSSAGGVIHYMIKVKMVRQELVIYAVVVILLLLYRLVKEVVWHSPRKFRKP